MIDDSATRRAYFASLSTPDLIVCATVERSRYDAADIELIHSELVRRGVNVERLAVPTAQFGDVLGVTPSAFSTPLPGGSEWWREGWQVCSRHLGFLATIAGVFTLPLWIIDRALNDAHNRDLSLGHLAHLLVIVALDALLAASVFNGLHRRMSQGSGSVGMAIASGIASLGRVFRETAKAYALAFGPSVLLFAIGQSNEETGLKALAWVWGCTGGVYFLLMRVFWVQPIAICTQGEKNLFELSRRYSKGRFWTLYWFLILSVLTLFIGAMCMALEKAILPGPVLEPVAIYFSCLMLMIFLKVTLLIGYYHVSAHPDSKPQTAESQALPSPPGLTPQA